MSLLKHLEERVPFFVYRIMYIIVKMWEILGLLNTNSLLKVKYVNKSQINAPK